MFDARTTIQRLSEVQLGALIIAALGVVFSVIGAFTDLDRFLHVYLVAYVFFTEIALGSLGLLLAHHLIKAGWSTALERFLAAAARTLPLMAVLFIPILLGMSRLYPWVTNAAQQNAYLNVPFFIVRAVLYFVVWIGISYTLTNLSYRQDEGAVASGQIQRVSIIGVILLFITASFAAVDWLMSLDPEWISTVYGWQAMSRQALAALGFSILALSFFWLREPIRTFATERIRVDIGAMLLVGLLSWVYLTWMQYFIIWSANIANKASWYEPRTTGTWGIFITLFALIHAVALVLLLLPGMKRNHTVLMSVAGLLLIMRLPELFWEVMPSIIADFYIQWWDFALPVAIGGAWLALFLWSLTSHRILPGTVAAAPPERAEDSARA